MYRVRKVFLVPVIVSAVLGLSACGSSDTSGAPSSGPDMTSMASRNATSPPVTAATPTPEAEATGPHNLADVDFATAMIPHHAQAIEMARIVLKRTDNPEIKALATRIEGAQAPEITMLAGWLTGWGAPVPDTSAHGGMEMDGMMSESDLRELETTRQSKVDALFLNQMIEHHQGAIAMARDELASGSNPQAKELAQSIKKSQTAEVASMKALLTSIS